MTNTDANADLFWDDADTETSATDIESILDNYSPGEIARVQRAVRLHDVFAVRVGDTIRSFDTSEEAEAWADSQEKVS